jgi:hypothetical protein
MYTPGVGSISGVLHLTAKHPYIVAALAIVLLGASLVKPIPPPPSLQSPKPPAFALQKPASERAVISKLKTK